MFAGRCNCHRQEVKGEEERTEEEGQDPLTPGECLLLEVLYCQSSEGQSHWEEGQADDQPSPDLVAVDDEVDLTQFTVGTWERDTGDSWDIGNIDTLNG